jgi:hypothetical protein
LGCLVEDAPLKVQRLIEKVDEQTMLAIIAQEHNVFPDYAAIASAARRIAGNQGLPYGHGAALGEHERVYLDPPRPRMSVEETMRKAGVLTSRSERVATDAVSVLTRAHEAAERDAGVLSGLVDLSQGSLGTTQAVQAGNQIEAANNAKLDQIRAAQTSLAYVEARRLAAEEAERRLMFQQRHDDTRDFLTGPMPLLGGGGGSTESDPDAIWYGM